MAGDARSTLLIFLITGTAVETGAREPAHTASNLAYQRQRFDRLRESRQMARFCVLGVRTGSVAPPNYCSIFSRSLQPRISRVRFAKVANSVR
jgi:hypothetical protein